MPTCKTCNNEFSRVKWIDGKRYRYSSRTRCFDCSPLRNKAGEGRASRGILCNSCGRSITSKHNRGWHKCYMCYQKERVFEKKKTVLNVLGYCCWKCGYGGKVEQMGMLDFHHMDRNEKKFSLDARRLANLSWNRVVEEIRKCCLLCCRCHREVELKLISDLEIQEIYRKSWEKLDANWLELTNKTFNYNGS